MELRSSYKWLIYLLFLLSGSCALIYEVLWSKYLSLTFGTTIWAISVVTATFMAGLALGSYAFGRYSAFHDRDLLKVYAKLEAAIALSALLFAPVLIMVEDIYLFWTRMLPNAPWLTTPVNFIFCAILLLPPAFCMGGTFPIMCRLFARRKCGGQIGRLYALNTLGATLGAFSAGYLLIPALGLSRTGFLAAGINLLIAAASYQIFRWSTPASNADPLPEKREWEPWRRQHRLVLVAIGCIGFFTLAYEILWTRVLLLFLGNTVYAFSMILSAFLVGIAIGGAVYARLVRPSLNESRILYRLTLLMGLSVLATAPFYDQLALAFQFIHEVAGESWWTISLLSFLLTFLVIGPPTILSGTMLPAAVAILEPGEQHTGEGVGLVLLHNTTGAVLGSLVAGFILVPSIGLLNSFRLLALANIGLGFLLAYRFQIGRALPRTLQFTGVVAVASLLLTVSWDSALMNSGVYCYAAKYAEAGGLQNVLAKERILEVIEGADTTVAVHEGLEGGERFFSVNGKTDGGTGRDLATQVLVGHIPLLLHQSPSEVLVIGLGTGITLRGMSAHPTNNIDCVEVSAEVVKASSYFLNANDRALTDPKIRLYIQDGRNQLLTHEKQYDVIVSEPSNPWQTGNANLFTREFYEIAARRLNPGGIYCQWLGLYDITPANLRMACRTFLKTFPRALVFIVNSDLILVGSHAPLQFDYQALSRRMRNPTVARTLAAAGIKDPGDLMARHYVYGGRHLAMFAGSGPLNTDDRPVLEYSARFNLGEKTLGAYQMMNLKSLLAVRDKIYLPLVNLGSNERTVALALRELAAGFARNGRQAEADHFLREARDIESVGSG